MSSESKNDAFCCDDIKGTLSELIKFNKKAFPIKSGDNYKEDLIKKC